MRDGEDLDELITPERLEQEFLTIALDGADVKDWISTPAGRVIVRKAKDDFMAALMDLAEIDLDAQRDKARSIQMQAQVSLRLIKYLSMAINEGKAALEQIDRGT